ncbi:MAG: GNAT family N-acetyltransferase [Candidatus Thorarchaeota archaeon]|nr:GNAT family N-acetyltransferase [Candidatus Thorarchaeota archaeon]
MRCIPIFIEMKKQAFENARLLFRGFDYQVIVRAVIDGTSPGKIWVNDVNHPECGFMATTEGWFLAGGPEKDEFNHGLRKLVHDMVLRGDYYSPVNPEFLSELFFHIDTERWISKFDFIFDIRPPLPSHRIHFTCNQVAFDWREKIPEGYRLLSVDSTLDVDALEFPKDIKKWMEYNLEDQKKRGFGKCLVHGNKVVVWINADCASGDECEIGIITTEDYRRRGLGALTAAAAVEGCFSRGYSLVGWHSDDINSGSIGTAQKVGFTKERDYIHYICMFSEAEHFAESGLRHFYNNQFKDALSDFEEAFRIGEVSTWAYVLAGRSCTALGDTKEASKYFISAKLEGWSNWDWLFKNEEMKSRFGAKEWQELVAQLE